MGQNDSSFLLFLAVLPALAVMFFVWKMDKREKEPISLLIQLLGLGALSTISAIILEIVAQGVLNEFAENWIDKSYYSKDTLFMSESHRLCYQLINTFLCVALIEEAGKFVMLYLRTWKCPDFDFSYDAVVYSVATSLGFATVENIMYVFGSEDSIQTALLRAVLSVPGHAFFSVFMGCFYGRAKYAHYMKDKKGTRRNMLLALTSATVIHGFYDFCLFMGDDEYIITFFAFEIILTIVSITMIIMLSRHDKQVGVPRALVNPFYTGYPQPFFPPVNPVYPGYPQPYRPPVNPGYPAQTGYPQPYRPPVSTGYPAQTGYPQPYRPPVNPGYPMQTGYPQPYRPPVNPGYPMQTGYPQPYQPQMQQNNSVQTQYPNGLPRPAATQNTSMPELTSLPKTDAPSASGIRTETAVSDPFKADFSDPANPDL